MRYHEPDFSSRLFYQTLNYVFIFVLQPVKILPYDSESLKKSAKLPYHLLKHSD